MKASTRIGVMTLMVLSIFSGVALADPTLNGGDAGNTYTQASTLEAAIPLNSWYVYTGGYLTVPGDLNDWYKLNTQSGEYLNYQLDTADYDIAVQNIRNTANTTTLGPIDAGKTSQLSGATLSWDYKIGIDSQDPDYEFAMKRTTT
jgi:hypothetical protein